MQLPPVVMFQVHCRSCAAAEMHRLPLLGGGDWGLAPAVMVVVVAMVMVVVVVVVVVMVVVIMFIVPAQASDSSHMSACIRHGSGRT